MKIAFLSRKQFWSFNKWLIPQMWDPEESIVVHSNLFLDSLDLLHHVMLLDEFSKALIKKN